MNSLVNLVLYINILMFTNVTAFRIFDKFHKSKSSGEVMDVSDFSVYYDVKTNETIKDMMPRPWYRPGWPLRLPFTGGPCSCEGVQCTCCSGIRIPIYKFDRKVCTTLTYNITEATLDMNVSLNEKEIYRNSYSARNPPPFCTPIPVPYLPPGLVDFCVRLFDISIVDQALHVCMDMDTRIDKAPVLVLHFDCMNMGLNGISLTKPGGGTNQLGSNNVTNVVTTVQPDQMNSDIFDPVYEPIDTENNSSNLADAAASVSANGTKYSNDVLSEQVNSDVYDEVIDKNFNEIKL